MNGARGFWDTTTTSSQTETDGHDELTIVNNKWRDGGGGKGVSLDERMNDIPLCVREDLDR